MQEGMLPVLEWTFLQPGQRIVVAQGSLAACGKSHWTDTHTAPQGAGCVLGELQPLESPDQSRIILKDCSTQGSVLELGKAEEAAAVTLERAQPLRGDALEALVELGMKD